MNKRACVYFRSKKDFISECTNNVVLYADLTNKLRLCFFIEDENPELRSPDAWGFETMVSVHEAPTQYLLFDRKLKQPASGLFVLKDTDRFWWQDIDVWFNLPLTLESRLKPVSSHLYFMSLQKIAEQWNIPYVYPAQI